MATFTEQLQTLNLSAQEVYTGSGGTWSPELIDDYLTILSNTRVIAKGSDELVVRVENLEFRMDNVEGRLDAVEARLDSAESRISVNETNIQANADQIEINVTNISNNASNISTNSSNITSVTNNFNSHNSSNSQHGVSGVNVGTEDYCTELVGGVALLCQLVSDAVSSTATISLSDIASAPATYDQTHIDTLVTMANDTKAKHNTLVSDLNGAVTQINDIIAKMKTAKQMDAI